MKVEEYGPLMIVTGLPAEEVGESLDHAPPVEQMQTIDAIMRFYFGAAQWLAVRNRQQPGFERSGQSSLE